MHMDGWRGHKTRDFRQAGAARVPAGRARLGDCKATQLHPIPYTYHIEHTIPNYFISYHFVPYYFIFHIFMLYPTLPYPYHTLPYNTQKRDCQAVPASHHQPLHHHLVSCPTRWSLYCSLALCIDHLVLTERRGYSNVLGVVKPMFKNFVIFTLLF